MILYFIYLCSSWVASIYRIFTIDVFSFMTESFLVWQDLSGSACSCDFQRVTPKSDDTFWCFQGIFIFWIDEFTFWIDTMPCWFNMVRNWARYKNLFLFWHNRVTLDTERYCQRVSSSFLWKLVLVDYLLGFVGSTANPQACNCNEDVQDVLLGTASSGNHSNGFSLFGKF